MWPFIVEFILNLLSSFSFLPPVCFKVFDIDRDGVLSEEELQHMVDVLLFVCHENKSAEELASDPYGQAGKWCDEQCIVCKAHRSRLWPCIFTHYDVASSHILIPLFWPFLSGFDKSGWDHVVGELASNSSLLMCRSLSANSSSVFHWVRLNAFLLYGMTLSISNLYFIKNVLSCFIFFLKLFYILLPIFHIENGFWWSLWFYWA